MKGTTTKTYVYDAVIDCASSKELDWSKIYSVATDAAKSMTVLKQGFIGRLKNQTCFRLQLRFYCRGQGLNHRQFKEFLVCGK